jgi:hypothetical protein
MLNSICLSVFFPFKDDDVGGGDDDVNTVW